MQIRESHEYPESIISPVSKMPISKSQRWLALAVLTIFLEIETVYFEILSFYFPEYCDSTWAWLNLIEEYNCIYNFY